MMKKSMLFLTIILASLLSCADNSPTNQYAEILRHVITELKNNVDKPQIAGQNIIKYIEENQEKITQLQTALAALSDEQMYEDNNRIAKPSVDLLNLVKSNQGFGQDENIVKALFLLKIIE